MLALQRRDRVRFIYFVVTVLSLKKLLLAVDDEFPALEYLHIAPVAKHDTHFTLSPTFEAPHLRELWLTHFTSPIGSPLLSTPIGLVVLTLEWIHPSTYPHPNNFLQLLSLLTHLEEITLSFRSSVPIHDIERQMSQAPITIHVLHPNLHFFVFTGVSSFLEAILPHLTAPLLETFRVRYSNQLRFSVPNFANFMENIDKFRCSLVYFVFHHEAVALFSYTAPGVKSSLFEFTVSCGHLDWQVSSAAQISNVLCPLFSEVTDLTLDYREHTLSFEWHNQADPTHWRKLLGSFGNVKTLRVHNGLVGEVSRSLILDGETLLEILPDLKELICPMRSVEDKIFAPFIHEREVAGQPVNLVGEIDPVGHNEYYFCSSAGTIRISPGSVTLL
jgi:hypothetical protein